MNDVLSDLLGKLVEVKRREFTAVRGEVRAVSATANGFHFIIQTDESMLIGYVLHECSVTLLYRCPNPRCSHLASFPFPAHELKKHDEQYHPPRCRARWRAGFLVPPGAPPDGSRCTRPKGHEGDCSFERVVERNETRKHAFVPLSKKTVHDGPADQTCELCGHDPRNVIHEED